MPDPAIFRINGIVFPHLDNWGKMNIEWVRGYRTPGFEPVTLDIILDNGSLMNKTPEYEDMYIRALLPNLKEMKWTDHKPYTNPTYLHELMFGGSVVELMMEYPSKTVISRERTLHSRYWGEGSSGGPMHAISPGTRAYSRSLR
jgi:hypothetical protein